MFTYNFYLYLFDYTRARKIVILSAAYLKFVELIERGLEDYKECPEDHTPNAVTKKALENVRAKKGLQRADTVEELFKKLDQWCAYHHLGIPI